LALARPPLTYAPFALGTDLPEMFLPVPTWTVRAFTRHESRYVQRDAFFGDTLVTNFISASEVVLKLHRPSVVLWLVLFVASLAITVSASQAQDTSGKDAALSVPHTTTPVPSDCSNNSSPSWEKVPRVILSKESATILRLDAKKPLALEFLRSDRSIVATSVPDTVRSRLDFFHAEYAFQWDENRLYGYVEIKEKDLDTSHPKISDKSFRRSPYEAAFEDVFHSTAVIEIGAPSWKRWITEMHVHVRPPNAKPMTSMFFGRTNNEENFRGLNGEATACRTADGWTVKFAVAWLPFGDWQPKTGAIAALKLVAPLPQSHEGYVLVSVKPFTLTK
jgi:hypothetical protein